MNFIIDPNKISFSQIRQDILDFIDNAADNAKWKDFFDSSVGQTFVELFSGVSAFIAFHNIIGRREAYLLFANKISSAIGIAQTLGASAFRGRNAHLSLTITPNQTTVLTKYQIVGSVKDNDIIVLQDTPITSGVQTTIKVAIGPFDTESVTVPSDNLDAFRFSSPNVSEDVRLLLNGTEVEISNRILDLVNDKFTLLTNPLQSVDVSYLNQDTAPVQYATGDTLTIEFLRLAEISFTLSDLRFNYGTLNSFITDDAFLRAETIEEIQINAPLFHETQNIVRGRADFRKIFLGLDTSIIDTNDRDVSPVIIELTYIKEDNTLFTEIEKQDLIDTLNGNRTMGVAPPTMVDPIRMDVNLEFIVTLLNNSGDPINHIESVVSQFENKLGQTLDFLDLENKVEAASFIQTARVRLLSEEWAALTGYGRGNYINPTVENGLIYEMTEILRFTDVAEPTWSTTNGDTIIDNDIVWETENVDLCVESFTWTPSTIKKLDNIVVPTIPNGKQYRAVDFINRSFGNNEIQRISFSSVPTSGTWRLHRDDSVLPEESTINLAYNATALDVQNALNDLNGLSEVIVTGDYITDMIINYQGSDGNKQQPLLDVSNPGTDEIQLISFSDIPNNGTWGLRFDGFDTAPLSYNATAIDVKSALEALPNIDLVSVNGDYSNGISVTFEGLNAKQDVVQLELSNVASVGVDEVQRIIFSSPPTSGTWRIHFGSEFTPELAYNAPNNVIQAELNNLTSLSNVLVTGDYVLGIDITYQGVDGKKNQPSVDVNNPGQNSIQRLAFSLPPDNGSLIITHAGNETTPILSNASLADIKAALEVLPSIDVVSVTGDFATGILVEFTSTSGLQPQSLLSVSYLGNDETQRLSFDKVPDAGVFSLDFNGQTTINLGFDATAAEIEAALENLSNIDDVTVTGNFISDFIITFTGSLAKIDVNDLTIITNTLSAKETSEVIVENFTSAAVLGGKYFTLNSPTTSYYVWFDTDNASVDPSPGGLTSIEVDINTGDSDVIIASALRNVLQAHPDFSASASLNTVTIINGSVGNVSDTVDVDTGFTISTLKQGAATGGVNITHSVDVNGKRPANLYTRLGVPITVSTSETQPGLIPSPNLDSGSVTASVIIVTEGEEVVSNLDRSGTNVVVSFSTTVEGEVPASNLLDGITPVVVTPTTTVDAADVEPVWPTTIGDTIIDNDILWTMVALNGTPSIWAPDTNYKSGEYVQPSTVVLDGSNVQLMAQVLGFVGNSSSSEPIFPTTIGDNVTDNNIIWTARDPDKSLTNVDFNEYLRISQTVIIPS